MEIWDLKHTYKIQEIICQVFGDICDIPAYDSYSQMEDDVLSADNDDYMQEHMWDNWDNLAQDDSFLELAIDNLSLSQLSNES